MAGPRGVPDARAAVQPISTARRAPPATRNSGADWTSFFTHILHFIHDFPRCFGVSAWMKETARPRRDRARPGRRGCVGFLVTKEEYQGKMLADRGPLLSLILRFLLDFSAVL